MKQISYQMHPDTTKQELIDHLFDLSLILQDRPKTGWWHVDHKYNHSDKHFDKTQDELIESLIERNLNTQKNDRTDAASSFDTGVVSKENILAESILDNMEEIADWLLSDDDCLLDINTQIKDEKTGKPINIGYGFANGLKGFSTNNARVVLTKEFNNPEGFAIRTMYPFFDETHSMYNGVDGLKLLHRNETFKNASPAQQDYIRTLITHRNIYARQQKDSGEIRYVITDTKNKNAPIRYTVYDKKEDIIPTMSVLALKLYQDKDIKCDFLPMAVLPPENYKRGLNFRKKYKLIPGEMMTADEIKKKYFKTKNPKRLEGFDYDFHMRIAKKLPKKFWY